MTTDIERWPPPNDSVAFESLCLALWQDIWRDPGAQKNGRRGHAQAGVDVFGQHRGKWEGVQCKQNDGLVWSKVTINELEAEVEQAKKFTPPLSNYILATTGPRDARLQERARELTEQHRQQQIFDVEVWSWEDIWGELYRRQDLLRRIASDYWPRLMAATQHGGERTVRLERANGLLKLEVPVGDYIEIDHQGSVVKVMMEEIVEREFPTLMGGRRRGRGCRINVDNGGGLLFCGEQCEKTDVNEFILPTKEFNLDEPVSVYFFGATAEWHRFFRLFVEHVNHRTEVVTLNVFLSHSWHGSENE